MIRAFEPMGIMAIVLAIAKGLSRKRLGWAPSGHMVEPISSSIYNFDAMVI